MRTIPAAVLAVSAAVLLAACGGSGSSPATAASLANRIPGCGALVVNTPPVMARQDVTCQMADGELIEIVTFASPAAETQWISDGGEPIAPDPVYAGCCVQGAGWAADVDAPYDFDPVVKALGGREVTG